MFGLGEHHVGEDLDPAEPWWTGGPVDRWTDCPVDRSRRDSARDDGGGVKAQAFTLLFAYGYDAPEGPFPFEVPPAVAEEPAENGWLLRIGLTRTEDENVWPEFLRGWHGTPLVGLEVRRRVMKT
jgi:hypothetical protein